MDPMGILYREWYSLLTQEPPVGVPVWVYAPEQTERANDLVRRHSVMLALRYPDCFLVGEEFLHVCRIFNAFMNSLQREWRAKIYLH